MTREELIDTGNLGDRLDVMHGRGSASGADVTDAYVYKLRDGLIAECWEYKTRQSMETWS